MYDEYDSIIESDDSVIESAFESEIAEVPMDVDSIMDAGVNDFSQFEIPVTTDEVEVFTEVEQLEAIEEVGIESVEAESDVNTIMETGQDDFAQFEVSEESVEFDETQINYDEVLEGIQQDALNQGFEHINIDSDIERLTDTLDDFEAETWQNLTLDEQKGAMNALADYMVDVVGLENKPTIEYYNNERLGDYGGYDPSTNTLSVNEYMLHENMEAADTIVHEIWHAHQHERASNPQSALDYQYQYNFDNYISPDLGQEAYENQLVEAEARAFAAQIKDRLNWRTA